MNEYEKWRVVLNALQALATLAIPFVVVYYSDWLKRHRMEKVGITKYKYKYKYSDQGKLENIEEHHHHHEDDDTNETE